MRPATSGHRSGGRNRQFFTGLSGFARGLTAAAERNRMEPAPTKKTDHAMARQAVIDAQLKRERKAAARARAAHKSEG